MSRVVLRRAVVGERGVTLVEILVATAILGLAVTAAVELNDTLTNSYLFTVGRVNAQQNTRMALERVTRELRAGSQVLSAASCDAGGSDITFVFQDDTASDVTVRYWLNGTNLQRNQTSPVPATPQPEVLIGSVQSFSLVCYDSSGAPTATVANVRSVNVSLLAQTDEAVMATSQANQAVTMASRVGLRNR